MVVAGRGVGGGDNCRFPFGNEMVKGATEAAKARRKQGPSGMTSKKNPWGRAAALLLYCVGAGGEKQAGDGVDPEEVVGEVEAGPDARTPDVAAEYFHDGADAGDQGELEQEPLERAGLGAVGLEIVAIEAGLGALADAADRLVVCQ